MANESLKRVNTSGGNRRVWTWAAWLKRSNITPSGNVCPFSGANPVFNTSGQQELSLLLGTGDDFSVYFGTSGVAIDGTVTPTQRFRDSGNWFHLIVAFDSTKVTSADRVKIYLNGNLITDLSASSYPSRNYETSLNRSGFTINVGGKSASGNEWLGEMSDVFFVDGQALTPDVFGFYKQGKGYISVGSTQATDFRPGQWVPKTPRVIKTEINRRGGFGVNGFYLPMNDSNNFGADFHCTPNSIIKLQENLPQPRCRIDGVGDYTGALRDDPFKQYLIYAQPNVLGGLQNGYGDYSHIIRGSGSPKVITGGASGTPTISTTQSLYYGSSLYFDGNDTINVETGDSNYLGRDFTIEFWVWHDSAYPINQMAFNTVPHTSFGISLNRGGSGQTSLFVGNGSSWQLTDFRSGGRLYSQQWNHVAVERYNNTITIYHNGVAQASYKQGDQVVTNSGTFTGVMPTGFSSSLRYGTYENTSGEPVLGYIQDYRIYSGVAKYKGGFDVPRPYTPVGIATWRAVPDCTANNFATLNGTSIPSKYTVSNGNLTFTNSTSNWTGWLEGTVGFSTGKYYWETRIDVSTDYHHIGIVGVGITHFNTIDTYRYGVSYQADGRYWAENNNLTQFQTGITQSKTVGDIVQVAVDMSNKRMWIGKNGTWFSGDPATGSSPPFDSTRGFNYAHYVPFYDSYGSSGLSMNFGQNPTFSGNTTAGTFTDSNSKGLFKYQPPSGFLALCEDNLPTPAISNPGQYFRTVLYTGTGASRNIVGVGFTPDLVWIKERNGADNHRLVDSVRGPIRELYSSLTNAEAIDSGGVLSFDSDGFSLGNGNSYNESGINHVAWCWRAGAGTTSTNTNGSITSVVSVNQDAGFSIVSFTKISGTQTVGHGLGKTPKFIITKQRDGAYGWWTYHESIGQSYLELNSTNAAISLTWGGTNNSSVFYINNSYAIAGQRVIAYCWAEIEGFSKAFSYVGNGSADGPLIYLNFKPALIIIKRTDNVGNWQIYDSSRMSTNPNNGVLFPNLSNVEGTGSAYDIDFLSNGFKLRSTDTDRNASGSTYVGFAWAESPFTTSNSK